MTAKLCECGCGLPAPIARQSDTNLGYVKGEPVRFRRGHNGRRERKLCACGCGERVKSSRGTWVKGHDKRRKGPAYIVDPETGCWVWSGSCKEKRPRINIDGRVVIAYRRYYEERHGPIPDGHHLHHTCVNSLCVNPDHLEPLSPLEHAARHSHRVSVS